VHKSRGLEAELLLHLGEIDERQLYLECAFPSMFALLSPQPAVPALIRKLPELPATATVPPPAPLAAGEPQPIAGPPRADALARRAVLAPLTEETYKVQFTASRAFRDKLRQAQDLLRHRVPDGDLAAILERALDVLIDDVKKERFAVGRKARQAPKEEVGSSRHIPDAIKRAVYERDEGRCTFADDSGRRCRETGALEFDHVDGFARTPRHDVDGIRLLCRARNQYAAEQVYGRAFMERARAPPLAS